MRVCVSLVAPVSVSLLLLAAGERSGKPSGELIFVGDFESGDLSGWRISGNSPSVVSSPVRAGKHAMKTVLDRYKSKVCYRTEVSGPGSKVGEEYWYGFSIFLPKDYAADRVWEIVAQWHGSPDFKIGETWRNPVMALKTHGGRWSLLNRWDAKPNTYAGGKRSYEGTMRWDFGPYRTGVWTDWVFHVKWSYKDDGFLQVWKDGKKILDRKGPNAFNDARGPYFKMGIYKGWRNSRVPCDAVSRRVLYHDEFRMAGAGASYRDVAPGASALLKKKTTSGKPSRRAKP